MAGSGDPQRLTRDERPRLGRALRPLLQRGTSSQRDPLHHPWPAPSRGGHRDPGEPAPGLHRCPTDESEPLVAAYAQLDADRTGLAQPTEGTYPNPKLGARSGPVKKADNYVDKHRRFESAIKKNS